jgi:predicted enzyme related to lactoylglutathione lyase
MNFVSIRLITADLPRLSQFYEQVTGLTLTR